MTASAQCSANQVWRPQDDAYFRGMTCKTTSADSSAVQGVLETALYVDDLVTSQEFYGQTLGLDLVTEVAGRHAFYRLGGGMLLIFDPLTTNTPPGPEDALPVPPHGATGAGHACFSVKAEDLDAWRAKLEGKGVRIEADFHWPNGARSVYFRDPAGNSLELADRSLWFDTSKG